MKADRQEFHKFEKAWQEYDAMVTRILPRFIKDKLSDLGDDLDHMLFCRSEVEEVFDRYPEDAKLIPYRTRIVSLDALLLLMRSEVLARLSPQYFASYRRRNDISRSHWWWYLEKVDTEPNEACADEPVSAMTRKH